MNGPAPHSTPSGFCHLCGSGPSLPIQGFEALKRVTSDCKPWPAGGQLFLCTACATVHKNVDSVWLDEMTRIYADYDIYHLSGGKEQPIFVPATGGLASRSQCLLEHLLRAVKLEPRGRLLEIGCGNGSFLKPFSQSLPEWTSVGTEFNDKYRDLVEAIPNVERLHTGPFEAVPGSFQMASMIHVLEHIPWPAQLMASLRGKLESGAKLVIDLPHHPPNPYDLVIADHCTHFTVDSVQRFLLRHGFAPSLVTTEWIRKELVVVAEPSDVPAQPPLLDLEGSQRQVGAALDYLNSVIYAARQLRSRGKLGIFGTSIAGTWLCGSVDGDFDFWVDEDPARLGRDYLGKPIFRPQDAPAGSAVLIALAPQLSNLLRDKLDQSCAQVNWFVPEDWS